jgi:hypothetical protein
MIKTSVLRYAAIGMATLSMAGFAAASTVTYGTTGPDSVNSTELNNSTDVSSTNTNVLGVGNFNGQGAESGDVHAAKNTTVGGTLGAGGSGSGNAMNTSNTSTGVVINNTGANAAALGALAGAGDVVTMTTTGPDSTNTVTTNNNKTVTVSNTNVVEVQNTNLQGAKSGNVSAYKNTTVGGLSSGNAANSNTTSTSLTINN